MTHYIRWFKDLGMQDVPIVGGKNASLGEMISNLANVGISVPDGFATTADAFREHLHANHLEERINAALVELDTDDIDALSKTGAAVRQWVVEAPLPAGLVGEVSSNAILAEEFLTRFDGFSIGSNDLTQLTLGLDRDSGLVAHLFDERDPAVKKMLGMAIKAAHAQGKYVGICGQGPSDHPDFAHWLMEQGISSVSLNPDTIVETWQFLAKSKQP